MGGATRLVENQEVIGEEIERINFDCKVYLFVSAMVP